MANPADQKKFNQSRSDYHHLATHCRMFFNVSESFTNHCIHESVNDINESRSEKIVKCLIIDEALN